MLRPKIMNAIKKTKNLNKKMKKSRTLQMIE